MTAPALAPLITGITGIANGGVLDRLGRLSPARQAAVEELLHAAPHPLPSDAVSRGVALPRLREVLRGADLGVLLPAALLGARMPRQLAYLGGRFCAEHALRRLSGSAPAIDIGERGAPAWPADVAGSITHTPDGAWAAVTWRHGDRILGIDSEPIVDEAGLRDILAVCCTPWERARWFSAGPAAAAAPLATALFSAKESLYKALHPHLLRFVDFTDVELTQVRDDGRAMRLRPAPSGSLAAGGAGWTARVLVAGGAVHTVVTDAGSRPPAVQGSPPLRPHRRDEGRG